MTKALVHACRADSGVARDQEFASSTESDAIDGSNTRLRPSFDECEERLVDEPADLCATGTFLEFVDVESAAERAISAGDHDRLDSWRRLCVLQMLEEVVQNCTDSPDIGGDEYHMNGDCSNIVQGCTDSRHIARYEYHMTGDYSNIVQDCTDSPHTGGYEYHMISNSSNIAQDCTDLPHNGGYEYHMTGKYSSIVQDCTDSPHIGGCEYHMSSKCSHKCSIQHWFLEGCRMPS